MNDDLDRADRLSRRLEILDALSAALDRRAELFEITWAAADADAARRAIISHFGFSDVQAVAVLDLQVRRFPRTERRRISDEADQIRREFDRQ